MKLAAFFLIFILIFVSLDLCASSTIKIEGKIIDDKKSPIPGATVFLLNSTDSSINKVNVTDENGIFILDGVQSGVYLLKITSIGFSTYFSDKINCESSNIAIPEISLDNESVNLKVTNITAFKPVIEVKPDMTVFNVESSINSTGSTAFELLQKAPGVVVDQNNNNIFLKGRGGVMVQIDGKPSQLSGEELAEMLKSMQSTNVEAIELIGNPSSKYDAEGSAGIINIRLKKNKNFGTNGSVTAGYAIGVYSKYNTSLTLNHRNQNINAFGTYSNSWGLKQNSIDVYRIQNGNIYDQSSVTDRDPWSQNFKAGIDYKINNKHTIGFITNGNITDFNATVKSQTDIKDLSGEKIKVLTSNAENKGENNNVNLNFNYRFVDSLGHALDVDLDYGRYRNERESYQPNIYSDVNGIDVLSENIYRFFTPTDIDIYTIKADYSQYFLKGKLGFGLKASVVNTYNTYTFYKVVDGVDSLDNSLSNQFDYNEDVYAGYINYQRTIKKFELQAGLRIEQTNSEGDLTSESTVSDQNVKRNYLDFFPSAGITYSVNQKNALGLTYTSRIDRPNYQELNPFEYRLDELTYFKGNPFLNPQYTNKVELSHTYNYSITTSLTYSNTRDYFAKVNDTIDINKAFLTPKNLASEEVLSLNFSASQQLLKWWSIYGNAGLVNLHYVADFGDGKTLDESLLTYDLYLQNTFKLMKNITFELSGSYNSPGVWGGTYKTEAQWSLDIGLQAKLLNDKASLRLTASDLFLTMPWQSYTDIGGIDVKANGAWESRQFRASLTYRFGNTNVKSIKQRASGAESELKRTQGNE